jgi:hypothetical protein
MFYNDYNRRHPRNRGHYQNTLKSNIENKSMIDKVAGTIAIIGLLILCHFFKSVGIGMAIVSFICGLWPLTILFIIVMVI